MRKILHVDLDAFFCSVEELKHSELKNVAFATGGTPTGRGVVTSCSYAARRYGVRSAMPMRKALQLCPKLKVVPGSHRLYSTYSGRVMAILNDLTPLVEQISIDEAFLDVSDLPQQSCVIAADIQTRIMRDTKLPCSIGAASNKLVAKIATNIGKANHKKPTAPMAIKVIPPGGEAEFLKPLPIREMWGVGPKSESILREKGIRVIGDIQKTPLKDLEGLIGNFAKSLKDRSYGIDNRTVGSEYGVKSISNERTFFNPLMKRSAVDSIAHKLSTKVGRRLRKQNISGKTVRLKLRWQDFETITRQISLDQTTNHDSVIFSCIRKLLDVNWVEGKGVRLLGVCVSNLEKNLHQLSLLNEDYQKERDLLKAIDDLQERFGEEIIKKGVLKK